MVVLLITIRCLENYYSNNSMPNGLGIGFVATPMLQAGIGLPLKTEVDFRYSPEIQVKILPFRFNRSWRKT